MGARSCIGVIDPDGELSLTYDHWMANWLPCELLPGPAYATRRARDGRPIGDWLDTVWAEGDALIDHRHHTLLLYGGEYTGYHRGYRLAMMDMLADTWPGWAVHWCHEALLDIIDYLGGDRRNYLVSVPVWPDPWYWQPLDTYLSGSPGRADDVESVGVVTLRRTGATVNRMLVHEWEILTAGPAAFAAGFDLPPLPLQGRCRAETGAHLDYDRREMTVWSCWSAPGIVETLTPIWPGWHIRYTGDDPAEHEHASGVRLTHPGMQPAGKHATLLDFAARMLSAGEPVRITEMVQWLENQSGTPLTVNPAIHDTTRPDQTRQHIAVHALRRLWDAWVRRNVMARQPDLAPRPLHDSPPPAATGEPSDVDRGRNRRDGRRAASLPYCRLWELGPERDPKER